MITRRNFLAIANTAMAVAGDAAPPLKDPAQRAGILFGTAAVNRMLFEEPVATKQILRNCSILTSTGEMKWSALRPGPAQFDFSSADAFVQFAAQNRIAVHGHTLVWYQSLPAWFGSVVNRRNAPDYLGQHIRTVLERYRSKIRYWDVVNEVIDPKSSRPDMLRDSPWLRLMGPDYIEHAFRNARAADPDATLVWNEDDLESDTPYSRSKRRGVLNLLKSLRNARTPVDGFGLQAHLKPAFDKNNRDYLDFLRALRDAGVKLLISEMDVIDTDLPEQGRDEAVASLYYDFVSSTCRVFKPVAIQVWELSDARNWIDTSMTDTSMMDTTRPSWRRPDGLPHRPAILDGNYNPKPAFRKLQQALEEIR